MGVDYYCIFDVNISTTHSISIVKNVTFFLDPIMSSDDLVLGVNQCLDWCVPSCCLLFFPCLIVSFGSCVVIERRLKANDANMLT